MKTSSESLHPLVHRRQYLAGLLFTPTVVADAATDAAAVDYLNAYLATNIGDLREAGSYSGATQLLYTELVEVAEYMDNTQRRRKMQPDQTRIHEMTASYFSDTYAAAQLRLGVSSVGRVATLVLASHIDTWRYNPTCIPSEVPMLGHETDPGIFYDMVGCSKPATK